jgi:SAM-dependent methyltransferase
MTATPHPSDEQRQIWNGAKGHAWVDAQEVLDRMFQPIETLLTESLDPARDGRVLDVGCGTGAITLAAARRLGASGHCTGIDISQPMIDAAAARARRDAVAARFLCADAETHPFETASVDVILSRFGIMFFADPVRAFTNLRRAARPGGRLQAAAWRSAAENPFMTTAERAAAPLLAKLPTPRPGAPGQFAFADAARVRRILAESGWSAIDIRPVDPVFTLPAAGLEEYATRLGPLGQILPEMDAPARARIVETVRAAFAPFVAGDQVRYTAACWLVSATA